jgi:NAD(P)-dependent dehydrogenase (short-subunit alcohol dehydrogenase family)
MCHALSKAGAKLAIIGRDGAKAERFAAEIAAAGGTAKGFACNVLDKKALINTAEAVAKALGPCDILVNAAGGNHSEGIAGQEYFDPLKEGPEETSFFDLDMDGIKFAFDLNLLGTMLPTQVFAKQMTGRKDCCVINISSMGAFKPLTKLVAYSGAKAAVSNFTQWLSVHLAESGIRVNALAPGFFITEQNRKRMLNDDGTYTHRAQKVIAQTPMRRFGEAEELVGALLWLADAKLSGFVTGVVLPVDGGFTAYGGV